MIADPSLVFPSPKAAAYVLYRRRFYVLGVFSFLAFNQCAFWLTFSPISPSTRQYYNVSSGTVDLLLNWGPIIFIPCLPLSYLLLNRPNGLRHTVLVLAIACLVATILRVIPAIITSPSKAHFKSISLPFIHAGQILNAACGPLVMMPVSQLSCLWFGPSERTRATTIAVMANVFGGTVSFLVNPAIVSRPSNIPYLLYFHLGLALIAAILALVYFPAEPPTAPSAAAELLMREGEQQPWGGLIALWDGLKQCMANLSFVLLSTAGGVMGGTFAVWTGLLSTILSPEYSEQQAGWFGFGSSLAGIVGGLCLGALADTPRFRRSLKTFVIICFTGCLLSVLWFQLSVRTVFSDNPLIRSTAATIGLSFTLAGLFQGAAAPLIYEALAEVMFPLPESLSAAVLVQWNNIACTILLFVANGRYKLINLLVFIVIASSIVMVVFTRVSYKRQGEDERKRKESILTLELGVSAPQSVSFSNSITSEPL